MTPLPLITTELHGGIIAIQQLLKTIGIGDTLTVFAGVARDAARGEPWKQIGPPADRNDALSRRQLGTAVLLERNLRNVATPERAREITAAIVHAASLVFLKNNVPVIRKKELLAMTPSRQKRYLRGIADKFFNADADLTLEGDTRLLFTVRCCRFVELIESIGEPGMATLFCEGDRDFFANHQPEIIFERPEKLSDGGQICDFQFCWKE